MPIKPKQVAQAQASTGGVGLNPKDESAWTEGGGLHDDFDGTILEMAFVEWDYDGKYDKSLFLAVEIQNDEAEAATEGNKNPFIQYYSAGDLANFVPSDDGKEAVPVGTKTGLNRNTNAYQFLLSMIDGGFDASLVGKRVDVFEQARFHFKRVPQKEREGLEKKKKAQGQKSEKKEILCAEQLISMPGEGQAQTQTIRPGTKPAPAPAPVATKPGPRPVPATTATKPQPRPAPAPAPAPVPVPVQAASNGDHGVPDDVQVWAGAYIIEAMTNAGGMHPKKGLAAGVINWAKEQGLDIPTRNKVIQALGNEAFLSTEGLGWVFDGENLIQAE